jgi:hypothetical protein
MTYSMGLRSFATKHYVQQACPGQPQNWFAGLGSLQGDSPGAVQLALYLALPELCHPLQGLHKQGRGLLLLICRPCKISCLSDQCDVLQTRAHARMAMSSIRGTHSIHPLLQGRRRPDPSYEARDKYCHWSSAARTGRLHNVPVTCKVQKHR